MRHYIVHVLSAAIRGLLVFVIVVVVQFAMGTVIGWLVRWRNPSWVLVTCVANTVILTCVLLVIQQFRSEGLTLYGVLFTLLMLWLASAAARLGKAGLEEIEIKRNAP